MRAVGLARGFVAMPIPGRGPPRRRAYDAADGRFVWVHVQDALRLAGGSVPAARVLPARCARTASRSPRGDWLLWILLLRALVDKGTLSPSATGRPCGGARRPRRAGRRTLAALAARHGHRPGARRLRRGRRRLAGTARARRPSRPPRRGGSPRGWRRRRRPAPRPRTRRGIAVAVLGPDGAGKTTLAEGLAGSLPFPTRIQYMGLTGGKLPRADRLRVPGLVFAAPGRDPLVALAARRVLPRAGPDRALRPLRARRAVPSGCRLTPLGPALAPAAAPACPLPDLVLVLDASGATMHARKGEYDPAVLERWRAAYARLAARDVGALVMLDAEQPAERASGPRRRPRSGGATRSCGTGGRA